MSRKNNVSRRDFMKMAGAVAAGGVLTACGVSATEVTCHSGSRRNSSTGSCDFSAGRPQRR